MNSGLQNKHKKPGPFSDGRVKLESLLLFVRLRMQLLPDLLRADLPQLGIVLTFQMCIRDSNQDGYTVYGAERFYYNWTMYDFFEGQGIENQRDLMFLIAVPAAD